MTDTPYQKRYLAHQARKKDQLMMSVGEDRPAYSEETMFAVGKALAYRRSQRIFISKAIDEKDLETILKAALYAPNSCNRHGLKLKVISERRDKELLSGLLVGGVGWIHRADKIVLFLADPVAYASPNEKDFMHYCDMGFAAMSMWLVAEALGLGAAYINPNLVDKAIFDGKFGKGHIFCGALVLGHYDKRVLPAERPELNEILL